MVIVEFPTESIGTYLLKITATTTADLKLLKNWIAIKINLRLCKRKPFGGAL